MAEDFYDFGKSMGLIRFMAEKIPDLPDDPDDYVTMTLTRRQAGVIYYAGNLASMMEQVGGGCHEDIISFMRKFEELVDAQKWNTWVYQLNEETA